MERGRFSWGQLGKADYSQSAALVASLPDQLRRMMRHKDEEILRRVVYLCWLHASKSGRGSAYCIPSESWLAGKIGQSVRTVQRCLVRLKQAGLIQWKRRRSIGQDWQTNLYELGKSFLASLYARKSQKVQRNHHTTKLAYNDLKKGIEAAAVIERAASSMSLSEILRQPRPALAYSQPYEVARSVMEREISVVDRKALLAEQFAALKARGL
jgi:hypothetical protein